MYLYYIVTGSRSRKEMFYKCNMNSEQHIHTNSIEEVKKRKICEKRKEHHTSVLNYPYVLYLTS